MVEMGIILTKLITLPIVTIYVIVNICSAMRDRG
jgi:hypothetical protein